jgi:hypothetical protein
LEEGLGYEDSNPELVDLLEILDELPLIYFHWYLFTRGKRLSTMLMMWKGASSAAYPPTFEASLPDPDTLTDPADFTFYESPFAKKRTARAAGLDLDGTLKTKHDLFGLNAAQGVDPAEAANNVQLSETIAKLGEQVQEEDRRRAVLGGPIDHAAAVATGLPANCASALTGFNLVPPAFSIDGTGDEQELVIKDGKIVAKEGTNVGQFWSTWFSWALGIVPALQTTHPGAAAEWMVFIRWMEQMQNTVPWKHLKAWYKHLRERVQVHKECSFHPASFAYVWELWREAYCRQVGVNIFDMVQHTRNSGLGSADDRKPKGRVREEKDPSAGSQQKKPCGFFNKAAGCNRGANCRFPHVCNVKKQDGQLCRKNHTRMSCPHLRDRANPNPTAGSQGGVTP